MAADKYSTWCELAAAEVAGKDFDIVVCRRPAAAVAVIAPHGGGIEPRSAEIAGAIAGPDFSFYCFKGLKKTGNRDLHIESRHFDEPSCLELIADHRWVLALHGFSAAGQRALLGGLDEALIGDLAQALQAAGISAETSGHSFPGTDPNNVCNRGASSMGAQFELSPSLRRGRRMPAFINAVRAVLSERQQQAA